MKNLTQFSFLLLSLFLFHGCMNMNYKPMVIGHRGAMGHETENTLASIQKAMDLGVDMIEIDVFLIKSGEIVVFHDKMINRLTNTEGSIEDLTYAELQEVIVEGGHSIPLLKDVLDLIDNKVLLNIELKGAGTTERVNDIIEDYIKEKQWSQEDFLISSFKWDELEKMRKLNNHIPIAILTEDNPLDALDMANTLKAQAINPDFDQLNNEIAKKIKDAGFKIYTWTVNEPEDIEKAKSWFVDGIITNFPERVN